MVHHVDVVNRVLIADDDRAVREALARALELAGYDVVTAADGVETLTRVRRDAFSALVVDVMMPYVDGAAVCRVLRADGDRTPVLMLTALGRTPDRIAGLEAGADDYLPKPFEVPELLARLRALIRRAELTQAAGAGRTAPAPPAAVEEVVRTGSLRVAPAARRAWWGDAELQLSKTEFDLLALLVRNEGIVLDHATLYRRVWGQEAAVDAKNLAGYVGYLRRKLAGAGAPGEVIHTVRGVGYAVRRPCEPSGRS
ncbi:two component transcriptional regulator, winged helix family [Actinobacteria bacterium OK074]|nr:two component transcriptional regulator, winged helix family [Actinobacteria bacterium OK074]